MSIFQDEISLIVITFNIMILWMSISRVKEELSQVQGLIHKSNEKMDEFKMKMNWWVMHSYPKQKTAMIEIKFCLISDYHYCHQFHHQYHHNHHISTSNYNSRPLIQDPTVCLKFLKIYKYSHMLSFLFIFRTLISLN